MKNPLSIGLTCFLIVFNTINAQTPIEKKADSLLSVMNIEAKIGQMSQIDLGVLCKGKICELQDPIALDTAKLRLAFSKYRVGSVLNCGCGFHALTRERWISIIDSIQQANRLFAGHDIPVLYGIDAIHGANYTIGATLFPQQIGQAATWNPDLVKAAAKITAYETRASGIPWNFSPVLDLARQPLWSRFFETYGEDVYLATRMTNASISGYQGEKLGDLNVAACMKHFLGYSYPLSGKDRTPAWIGDRELRAYFLPTFQEAIRLKAKTVMINSGDINGTPVHANPKILTGLLRDELGFDGVAVTDWEDIYKLHTLHRVAPSLRDAVKMAVMAGIDMSMTPNDFQFNELLLDLVKSGEVPESRIDVSVKRILKLKLELGIEKWDADYVRNYYPIFASPDFASVATATVSESLTLLKNELRNTTSDEAVLPLKQQDKVLVFGNAANSIKMLNGAWSQTWLGQDERYVDSTKPTILSALKFLATDKIIFANAADPKSCRRALKSKPSVAILCLGETPATEIPGNINQLELPVDENTRNLAKQLRAMNVPVVLVLCLGRPRIITEWAEAASAVLHTYLPGHEAAPVIASVLYGNINPSGKLPFTYPRYCGDIVHYDHKRTEDNDVNFGDKGYNPLFDFGFGLSYTRFQYSDLQVKAAKDTFFISVMLKNTGSRAGKEVVQVYYRDEYAAVTPSVKKLCGFMKIYATAGETKRVRFAIPAIQLGDIGADLKPFRAEGELKFFIGTETKQIQYNP
jgi:beta-glucosidase